MKRIWLAGAVLATACGAADPQGAGGGEAEAEECLRTKVWEQYTDGWTTRTQDTTSLKNGASKTWKLNMYGTETYQLLVCADRRARNIDLLVYDEGDAPLLRDDDVSRQPRGMFTPPRTGTYWVVVHARDLATEPSDVALAVLYRR